MGAFQGFGTTKFAASFSNAGGLGIITGLNYRHKDFKNELTKMESLTDKPFGINITVDENGNKDEYLKLLEVGINAGVEIFSTSAYQATYIGERIHEAGCYWFPKCPLMKHALSLEKNGADAITLMGIEGAGYKNPNQHSTLVNLTMGKNLLTVPLIAAGGIGDARGFLGALALGAEAVCLGTAILSTEESPISLNNKLNRIHTDIFTKDYHQRLYNRTLGQSSVPSPSVAFQDEILPLKDLIENIMIGAENLLKSWGFDKREFKTFSPST
ncbi:hypothetical protein LCGC14_0710800 [marine sediment metagenome]|uniref:Uncharacterized protein n=1 Tax=marine sediment metagenome TaxID=412755 RepID=A0A0F9QJL0_9ZZZZ|nr:MAG: Nitronate monooxygenase [Candidatus Lokiarchaeum sp. GC14_75]